MGQLNALVISIILYGSNFHAYIQWKKIFSFDACIIRSNTQDFDNNKVCVCMCD